VIAGVSVAEVASPAERLAELKHENAQIRGKSFCIPGIPAEIGCNFKIIAL